MKKITYCLLLAAFLVSAPALAGDTWKESYDGTGAGEESSACMNAESQAKMNGAAACMGRFGLRVDEEMGECKCTKLVDDQKMCRVTLKVSCEKMQTRK